MNPTSTLKTMRSKFPGQCAQCRGAINKGVEILWSRESGAIHYGCRGAFAAAEPAPAATTRICRCRCDGYCENCSSFGCAYTDHGRKAAYRAR